MKNVIKASLALSALILSLGLTGCGLGGDDTANYCDTAKEKFAPFAEEDIETMMEGDGITKVADAFASVGEAATGDIKADYVFVADFMRKIADAKGDIASLSNMEADATKMQESGERIEKDLTSACSYTLGG